MTDRANSRPAPATRVAQAMRYLDGWTGAIVPPVQPSVTFARDARRLVAAGYALERIVVVDQFRWSAHVELVADFRRGSA